jgi:N-methylhydantoinase B
MAVMRDVEDDYVSIERAARDYGVVLKLVDADLAEYEIDEAATRKLRAEIAHARRGWVEEDAEDVARRYREGELDQMDLVRRYGVILDWDTGELLPNSTSQYREMFRSRIAANWDDAALAAE